MNHSIISRSRRVIERERETRQNDNKFNYRFFTYVGGGLCGTLIAAAAAAGMYKKPSGKISKFTPEKLKGFVNIT